MLPTNLKPRRFFKQQPVVVDRYAPFGVVVLDVVVAISPGAAVWFHVWLRFLSGICGVPPYRDFSPLASPVRPGAWGMADFVKFETGPSGLAVTAFRSRVAFCSASSQPCRRLNFDFATTTRCMGLSQFSCDGPCPSENPAAHPDTTLTRILPEPFPVRPPACHGCTDTTGPVF